MPTFDPSTLATIRAAHRDRIDAIAIKAMGSGSRLHQGMPHPLAFAGCWLVANGLPHDEPCYGEQRFGEGTEAYREFLDSMVPEARVEVLEHGRKAIFGGRHPLYLNDIERARQNRELNERTARILGVAA